MSEQRQPGWYWEKKKDSPLLKWQPAEYCSECGWMPREPELIGRRIPTPDEPWQAVPAEATPDMLDCFHDWSRHTEERWRDLLSAAPRP